jgi:hypothetical protein
VRYARTIVNSHYVSQAFMQSPFLSPPLPLPPRYFLVRAFWYFWLTIQNTANRHVSNAFDLIAVFISFSGGTKSLAVRPKTAWFLGSASRGGGNKLPRFLISAFPLQKKRRKKNQKSKKKEKKKASSAPGYIRRA